jgi:hypothetical protein
LTYSPCKSIVPGGECLLFSEIARSPCHEHPGRERHMGQATMTRRERRADGAVKKRTASALLARIIRYAPPWKIHSAASSSSWSCFCWCALPCTERSCARPPSPDLCPFSVTPQRG